MRTPSAKHFLEFGGFADGRRNKVASPDSEWIESTVTELQRRNSMSVEQNQDGLVFRSILRGFQALFFNARIIHVHSVSTYDVFVLEYYFMNSFVCYVLPAITLPKTLQQHFPKTIAYLANKISEEQMKLL